MEKFIGDWRVFLMLIWSLVWKGFALWRAGKNNQRYWFVVLLVLNTVGLAEIIYLLFFQKEGKLWLKLSKKAKK